MKSYIVLFSIWIFISIKMQKYKFNFKSKISSDALIFNICL